MHSPDSKRVTLVEVLERKKSYAEFVGIVQAAAHRLKDEGIAQLVGIQFYADPNSVQAGVLITFADAYHLMEHIEMITQWEEFHCLLDAAKPLDVRVYGKLSADAEAWLRQINVVSKTFTQHIAGFVR